MTAQACLPNEQGRANPTAHVFSHASTIAQARNRKNDGAVRTQASGLNVQFHRVYTTQA